MTVILFVVQSQLNQPPPVKPVTTPDNEFSGDRAYHILKRLLKENQPHPVGSPLNGAKLLIPFFGSLTITLMAALIAVTSPLYSESRPQHINIRYLENLDTGLAYYHLQSPNPIPERLASLMLSFTTTRNRV